MIRLIVGCGYLGCRVADRWTAAGDEVYALTRSNDRAEQLLARGYQVLIGDVTDPQTLPTLPPADTLLWAVGHDRRSGKSVHEVHVDGFRNLAAGVVEGTGRVVYISSTGVYGQQDGSWVDEASPCEPRRAGGKARLAAEQFLLASTWSDRTVIVRLAGIYGPQRLPRLKELLAGRPLRCDPDGVINLIHVDDATTAVIRAAELPLQLPRIYLVGDGHPVARGTFYQELAQQVRAPAPRFDSASVSSREAHRSGSHKRVTNDRMLRELNRRLRYPSYREGLIAIAQEELTNDR